MIYAFLFVFSLLASPGFSSYPVNEPNAVRMIKHLTDRVQQSRIMGEKATTAHYESALWNLIINGETDRATTHYDNQEIETTLQKSYDISSTGPTSDERLIMMAAIDQLAISQEKGQWINIALKNSNNSGHYNAAKRLLNTAYQKYNPKGAIQLPQTKALHPFQTILDITLSNSNFVFPYNDSAFRGVIYALKEDNLERAIQHDALGEQSIKDICPWLKRAWVGWDTIGKHGVKNFIGSAGVISQAQNSTGSFDVRMLNTSGSLGEDRGISVENWAPYLDAKDELFLDDETYRPTIKRIQTPATQPEPSYRNDLRVSVDANGDYIVEQYNESSTSSNDASHYQRTTRTTRISPENWLPYCNARGWDPATIRIESPHTTQTQHLSSADLLLGGINPIEDLTPPLMPGLFVSK